MLEDELNLLLVQLAEHNPRLLKSLRPGLHASSLRAWENEHGAYLPQDLFDLFCWSDGTLLDGSDSTDSPFTGSFFFLPFRDARKVPRPLNGAYIAYEAIKVLERDEIVLYLQPFISFPDESSGDQSGIFVPCTQTRYESLPLLGLVRRADEGAFLSSSIKALVTVQRRMYEEGLFQARSQLRGDAVASQDFLAKRTKLVEQCDPQLSELNARYWGLI